MDRNKFLNILMIHLTFNVVSSDATEKTCTQQSMTACWAPMGPDMKDLDTALVPVFTDVELDRVCRIYDGVSDCVEDIIDQCHIVDQHVFKGIDDGYEFLCDETKSDYLQYRSCFNNSNLAIEAIRCHTMLTLKLHELEYSNANFIYKMDRLCQYVNNYLDCVDNAVKSFCGQNAGHWQRELDRRILEPLTDASGCVLDASGIYHRRRTVSTTDNGNSAYFAQQTGDQTTFNTPALIGCTVAILAVVLGVVAAIVIKLTCFKKEHGTTRDLSPYRPSSDVCEHGNRLELADLSSGNSTYTLPTKEHPSPPPDYKRFASPRLSVVTVHDHDSPIMERQPPPYRRDIVGDEGYINPMYQAHEHDMSAVGE